MVTLSGKVGFVLPTLTGCLTVLSLFSSYAHRLPWGQLPQALALGAAVGLLMWVIFYAMPLTRRASSAVACVATLMVMLWMVFPYPIMPVMITLSMIVVLFDLSKSQLRTITSVMLLAVLLTTIVSVYQSAYAKATHDDGGLARASTAMTLAQIPDIYFIVPDRFTSPDGLQDCGLDPSEFVDALTDRGFYVRENALSSDTLETAEATRIATTTRTLRFLASILNLGIDIEPTIPYNIASNMVKHHAVGKILKDNGYVYHHIGDWWQETLCNPMADHNYVYEGRYSVIDYLSGNELMVAVVDRSWLRDANARSLLPDDMLLQANAKRNEYQLATFKEVAGNGEHPKFVFVHILLPHPPYTWTKDGEIQDSSNVAGLGGLGRYLEQTQFTMDYLLQMIDSVEDEDSVIIIQSDEGIAFTEDSVNKGLSSNQTDGVLTAWHMPGAEDCELDSVQITDVLDYVIKLLY